MSLDILDIGSSKWSAQHSVFRPLPGGGSILSGEPSTFTLPNVEDVSSLIKYNFYYILIIINYSLLSFVVKNLVWKKEQIIIKK